MQSSLITPVRRPDLSPRALVDGSTQELVEVMTGMFDQHIANRSGIDDLMHHLRESEGHLHDVVSTEAEGRAGVAVRQQEAERFTEQQNRKIATLQRELTALATQRDEKEKALKKLEADLQGALARLSQCGGPARDAEVLLQQLHTLEERERYLRNLENRLICCEDMRLEGTRTLDALKKEEEELGSVHGTFYQTARAQMEGNQAVAANLNQQLSEASERKRQLLDSKKVVTEGKHQRELYYQQLADVKGVLEADLRKAQNALAMAEQDMTDYMEHLLGAYASSDRLVSKLEEVMMLIKAACINLNTDHAFIGEVNEKASSVATELPEHRGLQSFCDAFRYIKGQVECLNGLQREHERWAVRGGDVVYEAVEPLLSALKQLVTCYDMMPDSAKREIPFTHEIIRNSTHLLNLVQETSLKYLEIERAREEEAEIVERANSKRTHLTKVTRRP
ncbi:hypothetical protein DIPPA_00308 [Diplonema papillatum]|nr:hypothetical protein DIPPA_00308 [Diplonema papillatum]